MSSLCILPAELLEWITSVISTSEQMRLWYCGDRILNIKLKNGGLKRSSLCWSGSNWMPWPRWYFTTFGAIEEVKWDVNLGTSMCPTLELNLLPTTLKRLHLDCEDVFILLRRQNVNMNDLLPLLHSLHLSGSRLREENLKNLPANLIELSVASFREKIQSSTIFSDLPRTIATLEFSFRIVDQSEHANELPSELIFLSVCAVECRFNWFSKLPKSLKVFKIQSPEFKPIWSTLPLLEELNLGFQVEYRFPESPFPESAFSQLPQSLKTLALSHLQDAVDQNEVMTHLPKRLTRFNLPTASIGHSELERLPTSLTDFDYQVKATHPDMISLLPPEAIRIHLGGGPYVGRLNPSPFPNKLLSLSIDSINDELCAMLPLGLRELKIIRGSITPQGASRLPKSLTHLETYWPLFDSDETFSHLGHLSELSIWSSMRHHQLTANWIDHLLRSTRSGTTNIKKRSLSNHTLGDDQSHHLTSLRITVELDEGSRALCGKKAFFQSLAKFKNLTTIRIHSGKTISSEHLRWIPPNVTKLKLGYLKTYPTASQLSLLPKWLIDLEFEVPHGTNRPRCKWKDETLQALPRSLQRFHIPGPFPKLTERMYDHTPPNLRDTSLGDAIGSPWISPLARLYANTSSAY